MFDLIVLIDESTIIH